MDEQTFRPSSQATSRSSTLPAAVGQKAGFGAGDISRGQHYQRQYYHDNNNGNNSNSNNNNNNSNNGKVKLLITPATDSYGSGRQQMDRRSNATATINEPQHQRSQQQQQQQQQNNRQTKNYHHYDYYTDSDLTSSLLPTATTQATLNNSYNYDYYNYNNTGGSSSISHNAANNYDQNILLFATEHSQPAPVAMVGQQRLANQQQAKHLASSRQQQHLANSQLDPAAAAANRMSSAHQQQQQQRHPSSPYAFAASGSAYGSGPGQTGKFVSHYPSWRQTHSPTASHYQNYAFHVPLHHLQSSTRHHHHHHRHNHYNNQHPVARPQSRYGFVTVPGGERVKLSHRSSFKSRTLAHIPQTVRDDARQRQQQQAASLRRPNSRPDVVGCQENQGELEEEEEEEEEEINYYDRPSLETRQFMLSEGDLLKVRSVVLDDGQENPFKPGTELSWEAEMMVRLMKRGYPIQELPTLVEAAKQVASSNSNQEGQASRQVNNEMTDRSRHPFQRRQSSHDLSGNVKQVWASSLSRAKSMPRGFSTANMQQDDADSIDLLITSIENEMGQLNAGGGPQPEVAQDLAEAGEAASEQPLGKNKTSPARGAAVTSGSVAATKQRSSGSAEAMQQGGETAPSATRGAIKQQKTKQRRTSSEQQVATKGLGDSRRNSKDDKTNRKSSSIQSRSGVATAKQNGSKLNQMARDGNNKQKKQADLKETKQEIIKKRNTECCIIQ